MKVIIAGSRNFNNYVQLKNVCNHLLNNFQKIEIVSGGCRGTDLLGERYALEHGYPIKRFPANWNRYGRAAGPKRNAQMAEYSDMLIAFWDGKSRGTFNMVQEAKSQGLIVVVIHIS